MDEKDFELNISQPPLTVWKRLLSAAFYTMGAVAFADICRQEHFLHLEPGEASEFNKNILLLLIGFFMGTYFAVRATLMIDVDSEQMVCRYAVGPFSRKVASKITEIKSVAVHKNPDGYYLVKIWYQKTKNLIVCYSETESEAFRTAAYIAEKLNTDLFDATEKGRFELRDKSSVR